MTAQGRRLLPPAAMTLAMMAVLLSLGTWQVQRLLWKQTLLAQIERAEAAPPNPLPNPLLVNPPPFAKISATGTFLPGKTALYGAEVRPTAMGTAMGARMIVPLRQSDGKILLVDRGWAPLTRTGPIDMPTGIATIAGYVRFADSRGWFSAKDDIVAHRFYTLDPVAIGAAIGEPDVPPFVLVVLGAGGDGPPDRWPDPARHLPRPANNHLVYAITWYGLAIALLTIFFIWARKATRA